MSNVRNRRLVIALIATSISVVVFSWLFRRSRLYVNAAHGKRANAIQTAWLWLRSFWIGGTEGGNGGGSTRTHQINPSEPNMAVLPSSSTEDHAESSNSTETSIANLAKRRISGSPRVVVLSTRRVLFNDGEGDSLQFLPGALEALKLWHSKRRGLEVYLITQCEQDSTEARARTMLQNANINGFNPHKALFCSTAQGLQHMARQVDPDVFIDSSVENLLAGEKWARSCILLGSEQAQGYPSLSNLVQSL